MAEVLPHITDEVKDFIGKQHVFFVATAPLDAEGHVNLSPKGMDSFRVLGDNEVGYIDLTGSGNETSAHIAENGRITLMFCAFEGPPNIIRLYGEGRVILPDTDDWQGLIHKFPEHLSARQLIIADVHRVQTSCGYSIPFMDYKSERESLTKYWVAKGKDALPEYHLKKNSTSIDGLATPLGRAVRDDDA